MQVYTLFLMSVFLTSCKQKQTYAPPGIIRSETKDSVSSYGPNSMVRNVKQASNGDILIASYTGVWRYDGKWFTNITSAISSPSFWDVLEERGAYAMMEDKKANIWTTGEVTLNGDWALFRYDQKYLYDKEPTVTEIKSQSGMLLGILEDAKGNIWFGSGGGVYRYDGKTITDFKSVAGQQ
jgi:ligand-binding sensor domain-containing protein